MTIRGFGRRCLTLALAGATLLAPVGSVAFAQQAGGQRPARQAPRAQQDRAALEAELQRRLAEIARRELALTDAQFARLQEVNRRFDGERRELLQRERQVRGDLRRELRRESAADEARVQTLLDQLLATQRARIALLESEQRALAEFLSPVQRARYIGLQEGFRRQLELRRYETREQRGEHRGPPPRSSGRPPGSGSGR